MIAFLSASIEMAIRSFANALLAIFPFLPASLATNPEQIMIITVSYTHLTLPTNREV